MIYYVKCVLFTNSSVKTAADFAVRYKIQVPTVQRCSSHHPLPPSPTPPLPADTQSTRPLHLYNEAVKIKITKYAVRVRVKE